MDREGYRVETNSRLVSIVCTDRAFCRDCGLRANKAAG